MATWVMTTERGARVVDREGVRKFSGSPPDAWRYIATHAGEADTVCVNYGDGHLPTTLTGGSLRLVLQWTQWWP
jgi:hypothetical protein